MRCERGTASVEWVGLLLTVSLVLGAMVAVVPGVDGRSFGGWLAHTLVCAVRDGCAENRREADALRAAYGERDAALVRELAPGLVYEPGTLTLPVDWRRCRSHRCSDARDDRDLDVHRSARGSPATVFTRVVRRDGRTYVQYWLYYPDSTSTVANAAGAWNHTVGRALGRGSYPGYHPDDWESVQVRLEPDGRRYVRASSHHAYQGCKERRCRNRWVPWTGWARVSRGSHAGHVPMRSRLVGVERRRDFPYVRRRYLDRPALPGRDLRERTSTPEGLDLVPLETLDRDRYEPLDAGIVPPWRKEVYEDPESDSTS